MYCSFFLFRYNKQKKGGIYLKNNKIFINIVLIIICAIAVVLLAKNKVYSATDIFQNAHFETENHSVQITSFDIERKAIYETIEIPKDKQVALIDCLKEAKFKEISDSKTMDEDYIIRITLNRTYTLFIDTENEIIRIKDDSKRYSVTTDFFNILKETAKEKHLRKSCIRCISLEGPPRFSMNCA